MTDSDIRSLKRFQRALRKLSEIDSEMPLSYAELFVSALIKHAEGHTEFTMKELEDESGYSQSAVSRGLARLSDKDTKTKKESYKLVDMFENPFDRRFRLVRVNSKGLTVMREISERLR